ncbi:hypothetical protein AXW84_18505 [Hymenobacter sp. PAMC 26628]|nr:hypothetical protein AXW84_18505 [Hymenobacter sp. PAMC 26628]
METAPSRTTTTPGLSFEEFWDAYAYKRDRKKSKGQWQSLKPAERVAALAAVPAYVAATPDKHFRKNPLTWLRGSCWLDEENPEPFKSRVSGPAGGSPPVAAPFAIADKVRQQQQNNYL